MLRNSHVNLQAAFRQPGDSTLAPMSGRSAPAPHTPTFSVGLQASASFSNVARRTLLRENKEMFNYLAKHANLNLVVSFIIYFSSKISWDTKLEHRRHLAGVANLHLKLAFRIGRMGHVIVTFLNTTIQQHFLSLNRSIRISGCL